MLCSECCGRATECCGRATECCGRATECCGRATVLGSRVLVVRVSLSTFKNCIYLLISCQGCELCSEKNSIDNRKNNFVHFHVVRARARVRVTARVKEKADD